MMRALFQKPLLLNETCPQERLGGDGTCQHDDLEDDQQRPTHLTLNIHAHLVQEYCRFWLHKNMKGHYYDHVTWNFVPPLYFTNDLI
jgi:hypothetical protein